MASHAQLPSASPVREGITRVYFAGRSTEHRSHVGFADVRLGPAPSVVNVSETPVLSPGPVGCFDEHGVYPASVVDVDTHRYLYFIGWNQGVRPPLFYASIGLAVSHDRGETFTRVSPAPIMQRSEHDPCLVTSPNVLRDGARWRMHYVSGIRWEQGADGSLQSFYHLKYAESADGRTWNASGHIAIDFAGPHETNIARPAVLRLEDGYAMWYSYVTHPPGRYRMGVATSTDGITWNRADARVGLNVPANGFDDDMLCYPSVIVHDDRIYLFYNGNSFGVAGFGVAVAPRPFRIADVLSERSG